MTIVSLNIQDGTTHKRHCIRRKRYIIPIVTVVIMLVVIAIYLLTKSNPILKKQPKANETVTPPDPDIPLPPSASKLRKFSQGSVSSDSIICSEIGKDILSQNGTAVDATIATMFCNGLVTMHSMGIGGGFLMTIYIKENKTAISLNAREVAPNAAKSDMFSDEKKSKIGALAVGVPGELKGYIEAHKRFGRLPWEELVKPTVELCNKGFNISKHQYNSMKYKEKDIKQDPVLSKLFFDSDGNKKNEGDLVVHKKYCKTLKIIQEDPESFYNGTLGDRIVKDLKNLGGIITKDDLLNYTVEWGDAVKINLSDNKFYSAPLPGSGNVLGFILNVLKYYNFTKDSIQDIESTVLTYHRTIEAFKYALARKTFLGDPNFVDTSMIIKNMTDDEFAKNIRFNRIKDNDTFDEPEHYGAHSVNKNDHGTAHISVLAPNGDAVSVTSTVNLYFGAAITSNSTGILFNSVMDDFSVSNFKNYFGLPYAEANKIEPGKRPLSSMSPTIIVDKNGDVRMVVGAAGGTKIPTSVALVIMRYLWFGKDIKEAVDEARFHNQVFPMTVSYEYGIIDDVVKGLESLGHDMERAKATGSVINAIVKENGTIYANADYRKGGDAAGI